MQHNQFRGYEEVTKNPYGLIEGDLARAVLQDFEKVREEKFPNLASLKGVLSVRETNQSPEGVLTGSNFPVLSVLHNYVPLESYGFKFGSPQQLAKMYNDEVKRVTEERTPFIQDNFWYDIQLIRNPAGRNQRLNLWECSLDESLSALVEKDKILAVPYSALKLTPQNLDNGILGQNEGFAFELNPDAGELVRVVNWNPEQTKEFNFGRFNEEIGVPEIDSASEKFSKKFDGLISKLFSRLYVNRNLGAYWDGDLAYFNDGVRIVGFSTGEASAQKISK